MFSAATLEKTETRFTSRMIAWLALGAAGLMFFGRLMPYVGVGDNSESLADAGAPMAVLYVGGGIVVLAAVVAVMNGVLKAAWFAAGVVAALSGPSLWILTSASKFISDYNADGWNEQAGLRPGALVHIVAMLLACAAGGMALANHAHWEPAVPAVRPPARGLLAAAFGAVPFAVLVEHGGWSVWDIDSGPVQFSALVWSLGPAGMAAWAAAQGRARGVVLSLGVAVGNLIAAIGMEQTQIYRDGSDSYEVRSTYQIPSPGLLLGGSIVAVVLGYVCLTQLNGASSAQLSVA